MSTGRTLLLMTVLPILAGCRQDMHDQPRYEPLEASQFFSDQRAARIPPQGTVARGRLNEDDHLHRGIGLDGELAETFPFPIDGDVLYRGRERYDIYCTPCHDGVGLGHGIVVRRGFKTPPSFHSDRLREAPPGHFFDVMTRGFGAMAPYAAQVSPEDRWAIAAYIRALQLSQNARISDLPPELQDRIREELPPR